MKAKRIVALLAIMACLLTVFTACGQPGKVTLENIMNPDWKADPKTIISGYREISTSGSYTSKSNSTFFVTKEAGTSGNADSTLRVYAYENETVLVSLSNFAVVNQVTGAVDYSVSDVHLISNEYFAVLSVQYTHPNSSSYANSSFFTQIPLYDSDATYTLAFYNKSGTKVKEYSHAELLAECDNLMTSFDKNYYVGDDETSLAYSYYKLASSGTHGLAKVGTCIYKVDKEGNKTLLKDFDYQRAPDLSKVTKGGNYYYEYIEGGFIIYDNMLNRLTYYAFPSYANDPEIYILANGNALLQYTVTLNFEATNYDFRNDTFEKYDLVTVLINPEKLEFKTIDSVNFVIHEFAAMTPDEDEENSMYSKTVENIAYVSFISKDKLIDENSDMNGQIVILSNDMSKVNTLDLAGDLKGLPRPINDEYYYAYSKYNDLYIYDKKGVMINTIYSTSMVGDYFHTANAIYTFTGEVVYDLKDKGATATTCGDSIIISIAKGNSVEKYLFCDGNTTYITTVSQEETSTVRNLYVGSGYYAIVNAVKLGDITKYEYNYYNELGEFIGTFEGQLSVAIYEDEFMIMRDSQNNKLYKFYLTEK